MMKIHVFPFQIGKPELTKYSWLNFLPFGKMLSTISLRPVRKITIIVCFVPMTCRVLGMTSVGGRANIFEEDENIKSRTRHLLQFLQSDSRPTRVEFVASLLMSQHGQLLSGVQKMGHPVP
jgi:hypothetical protein